MNQNKNYASFWIRFFAQILDSAFWGLVVTLGIFYISSLFSTSLQSFMHALMWLFLFLILVQSLLRVYVSLVLIEKCGGPVGKLLFGLRIEHEDSSLPTFKRAAFRELIAKIASKSLLGVGYYYIFKNEKRQSWHDLLSDTYVVKKSSSGTYLGIVLLFMLLVLNFTLLVFTAMNFSKNKQLMVEIASFAKTSVQNDLPTPPPTLNLP